MPPSWIAFALLLLVAAVSSKNLCSDITSSPSCTCKRPKPNQYEVKCGALTVEYEVDVWFGVLCSKPLSLSMNQQWVEHYSLDEDQDAHNPLDNLRMVRVPRAKTLQVFDCDVSNSTSAAPLAMLIMQTQAQVVKLRYMTFHAQRLELDYHDEGLGNVLANVTHLQLYNNALVDISYGMLEAMPALARLHVERNQLRRVAAIRVPQLVDLDLNGNNISDISPLAFRGLTQLKVIALYSNRISKLDALVFADLHELKSLELMTNQLTAIPQELFGSLGNLEELNLSINLLTELPQDVFSNNTNLTLIRLARNQLTTLPAAIFRRNTQVLNIALEENRIEQLDGATFEGLVNLQKLNLEQNLFTTLQAGLFDTLSALQELRLAGNKIALIEENAFFGLRNMRILDLSRNQLVHMNLTVFQGQANLRDLQLSDNHIVVEHSDFSFLNYLEDIEDIDLSRNNIDYIPLDFMGTKANLRLLNLNFNNLRVFDFLDLQSAISNVSLSLAFNDITIVTNMSWVDAHTYDTHMYKHLNLTGNPLRCDAWNYDLYRYFNLEMPMLRFCYEIAENLICASPEEMKGRPFHDEHAKINPCRFMYTLSHCPSQCSCYHVPLENSIIVDCASRNLQSVPELFVPAGGNYTEMRRMCNVTQAPTIKVILMKNHIKHLPPTSFVNINVTVLDVSFNNLSDVSWIPHGLESLMLDHNYLRRINKTLLEELKDVTLNNNPWICDCETVPFWIFLSDHEQIPNKMDVRCSDSQKSIRKLSRENLCPTYTRLIVIIGVVIAALILIPAAALIFFYKYKQEIKVWLFARNLCLWFVREEDLDRDKKYDAFISFSQKDESFILEHLLPNLEEVPDPYKICVHMRNWIPGEYIAKQVADSVLESRRTIVVLSPSFLESVWGRMEFRAAHLKAISEGIARVIIILYDDLDPNDERIDEELRVYLKTNTYIRWGDAWFWDKLRYALPHRKCLSSAAYVNKRFESVSVNLDKMDKMDKLNQNVSVVNGGTNLPPVDPLLLKVQAHPINGRCVSNTPPAEKGID